MVTKLTRDFIFTAIFTLAFSACQSEEPSQKTEYPAGPDYATMDSRGVEAVQTFDKPFMEAAVEYWDKEGINNNVVSPLSAAYVAALMANGADDEGCRDILKSFGLETVDLTTLNTTMSDIMSAIVHKTSGSEITLANSAWAHNSNDLTIKFTNEFASKLERYYQATLGYADLQTDCDAMTHSVNQWAKKAIGQDFAFFHPNDAAFVLLANVMTFEADWKKKFEKANTKERSFQNYDLSTSSVEFLDGRQDVEYALLENGEIISLKYDNANIRFNIFLPAKNAEFNSDFRVFDKSARDTKWLSGSTELIMPKLDFKAENQLCDIFIAMGMAKGFIANRFSRMIITSDPIDMDNMLDIKQSLKMSVDENGAKMVVASSAQTMYTSDLSEIPSQIIVNRPFLFEIVAYNQVIAAGRIMKL